MSCFWYAIPLTLAVAAIFAVVWWAFELFLIMYGERFK